MLTPAPLPDLAVPQQIVLQLSKNMIKVYSTPTCVYCRTLKEYLVKNNVEYIDIDVSKDEKLLQEMIKISGQMGVPVVDIDGEVIVGFDKNKIDKLAKIKQK
jgi:glutaredoxin-like YruB-family protein